MYICLLYLSRYCVYKLKLKDHYNFKYKLNLVAKRYVLFYFCLMLVSTIIKTPR